ncbi:PIG-L deacetylase family protein [Saccharopolyspora tripterygii]
MDCLNGDDFLAHQRVLVIAPHADDETYGCAGTIARIKSLGGEVCVIVGSVASIEQYGGQQTSGLRTVTADTRIAEFQSVAELLKVDDWEVLLRGPDQHMALDVVPRRDLAALLERDARLSIENVRPSMVMIPAISYNQDHEALFRACVTATRPCSPGDRHFVPHVLCYDNTSLFWTPERERFTPSLFVDISEFLQIKLQALALHASQVKDPLYHGSPEGLELQSRWRGREISAEAAEGYAAMRVVL